MNRTQLLQSLAVSVLCAAASGPAHAQNSTGMAKTPATAPAPEAPRDATELAGNLTPTPATLKVSFSADTEPQAVALMRSGDLAIMEGDIVLGSYSAVTSNGKNNALPDLNSLWPSKGAQASKTVPVPYVIDSTLTPSGRVALAAAIADFQAKTCVRFVPRTSEPDYLRVIKGQGCYSYIGWYRSGPQDVSIGQGCETKGSVSHELAHSLGFMHEQNRPDRDQYVTISPQNMLAGALPNFTKVPAADVTTLGLPYDYASILHYPNLAFTANGQPTITPKDLSKQIGQRVGLSPLDVQKINKLYKCP